MYITAWVNIILLVLGGAFSAGSVGAQPVPQSTTPPLPSVTAQKYALLVGINKYRYSNPKGGFFNLQGPVNDVQRMRNLLLSFGFQKDDIETLTNDQATHQGVVDAFKKQLIEKAKPGDIVVFYFSGHGSQADDPHKINQLVETIVAYDSRRPGRQQTDDITGDELNELVAQLQSNAITVIVDACHSGGLVGTRGIGVSRRIPADTKNTARGGEAKGVAVADTPFRVQSAKYAYIAAAAPEEVAQEFKFEGTYQGALTHFLTRDLLAHPQKTTTYNDVFPIIKNDVVAASPGQHPALDGTTTDSVVFSDVTEHPEPSVEAGPGEGGMVVLQAGNVHGMTSGSVFDIYPSGTHKFDPTVVKLGTATIKSVTSFTSAAKLQSPAQIPVGARAVERSHVYDDFKAQVWFDAPERSTTLQAIEKGIAANNIKISGTPAGSIVKITDEGQRIVIYGSDSQKVLDSVDKSADVVQEVVGKLAFWAKWFNVRAIANLQPAVALQFEIKPTDGTERRSASGELILTADATFRCVFVSQSDQPLYISVVDLKENGDVTTVYQSGNVPVVPGNRHTTQEFRATLPHGNKSATDVLKVFATDIPVDFSFLNQKADGKGIKGMTRGTESPLGQLLAQSGMGFTRDVQSVPSDWTVEEKVLQVEAAPNAPTAPTP